MMADEQHNRDEPRAAPTDAEQAWWDEAAEAPAQADASESDTRPLDQTVVPDEDQIELASGSEAPSHQAGLYAAALRDVGRVRQVNQDHVYTCVTSLPREEQDMQVGLFVVADGMGGHEGGEIASRIAISTVARHILGELVIPVLDDAFGAALQPLIVEAVKEANRAIWDQARAQGSDMGTTCTAVLVVGRTMYIGHVGDSRAYLLHGGMLQQLTSDHSAVGRLIQLGQLEPNEAREHPMRSQLYRTVGQQPDVHVDFIQRPLGQASHLMLCSDGLWSMLDDSVLKGVLDTGAPPPDMCRTLVEQANDAGGEDNISLVVVAL